MSHSNEYLDARWGKGGDVKGFEEGYCYEGWGARGQEEEDPKIYRFTNSTHMRWAHSFTKMELRYTPCVSVMHFHELYYCMPVSCVSTTTCRSFGAVACAGPGRRPHGASGMTLIPLLCLRWPDTQ